MAGIGDLILSSWNRTDEHVNHWGKEYETGYYCSPRGYRDIVEVDSEGNKTYRLWGTPLCYKTKDNEFYFYATDLGSKYYTCMSQTSKERITNLLNYGHISQRRYENYWVMGAKEIKLEMGSWYKVDIGKVDKCEGYIIGVDGIRLLKVIETKEKESETKEEEIINNFFATCQLEDVVKRIDSKIAKDLCIKIMTDKW